jgi:hypothetical protein
MMTSTRRKYHANSWVQAQAQQHQRHHPAVQLDPLVL